EPAAATAGNGRTAGGYRPWTRRHAEDPGTSGPLRPEATPPAAMGLQPGRLRIRAYAARSQRFEHRLGHLLRQQGHALRRARTHGALDRTLAHHAGFAAGRGAVPLPLDLAAGDRSVQPRKRVLRLPDGAAHR